MADASSLRELLLRWQELRKRGQAVSAEELCAERPDLLDEVKRQIDALLAMEESLGRTVEDAPQALLTNANLESRPTGERPLPDVPGYEVLEELGRGAMGVVYKARHLRLHRLEALKMILVGPHAGAAQLERFLAEARAVARLQHPNIVQIYEIGEQAGLPFLSLEFVDGGSLARQLAGGPPVPRSAAGIVQALARAAHAAHQRGIVHRDLKPANVLLSAEGTPKLTDFGLAKYLDEQSGQTRTGDVLGTPAYMAPEQADGNPAAVGPAADIYGLGAILYELLSGRPPFQGAGVRETLEKVRSHDPILPSRLRPDVPRDLETICLKCLQKAPARRYTSALALAQDLERFEAGESILARPEGRARRLLRRVRRHRAPLLASLACVVGVVVIAFLLVSRDQEHRVVELEHAIDAGLSPKVWTGDELAAVESRIEKLELLDPERAAIYQQRLRQRFRQDLADIRALPHLGEEDTRRYRANARLLEALEPGAERELLDLLEKRRRDWELVAELKPPFVTGPNPLVQTGLRVKDAALFRIGGRNPVTMLQTPAGSGMKIEATFDPSWSDAETVGVYLNADRPGLTGVRSLAATVGLVASAGEDGVCLWKVESGPGTKLLEYPGPASCVTLSWGTLAAGVGRDVLIWDARTIPPRKAAQFDAGCGEVLGIALAEGDGRWLAVSGRDGRIRVWAMSLPLSKPKPVTTLQESGRSVNQVAFTSDWQTLAAASDDGTVRFWNVSGWTPKPFVAHHPAPVWSLAVNPNGTLLATACKDRVTLWDVVKQRRIVGIRAQTRPTHCLAFAHAGNDLRLAVGTAIFRPSSLAAEKVFDPSSGAAGAAASTPQGDVLAAVDDTDRTVWLYELGKGRAPFPVERTRGYGFLLTRIPTSGAAHADEGALPPREDGLRKRRYLQILRNGICLREQTVDVPAGPLTLEARREGAVLEVEVDQGERLTYQDAFPPPDRQGRFGLHWPLATGLSSVGLRRQARASEPSPLEQADSLFDAGQFERAREVYRRQEEQSRTSEVAEEARYKAALCLEETRRHPQAVREYDSVSRGTGRWAALAAAHLWWIHQEQGETAQAEEILTRSGLWARPEEVFLALPEEMRQRIVRRYFHSHIGMHWLLPSPDIVSHLERLVRLTERLPDLPVSLEQSTFALMRAYEIVGSPEQAIVAAEAYLEKADARLASWNRLQVAVVLGEYSWLLVSREKGPAIRKQAARQVRDKLDSWLLQAPGGSAGDSYEMMLLLVERARLDVAMMDWQSAEQDIDRCLQANARLNPRGVCNASVTMARLIQGFIREAHDDKAGAARAWKEASLSQFPAVGPDLAAKLRFWATTGLEDQMPQLIQAAITDDLSPEEGKAIFDKAVSSLVGEPLLGEAIRAFAGNPSAARAYGTMWRTRRGRELARQYVLHEIPFPEAVRQPVFLYAHEVVRHQAFAGTYTKAQDEQVWKLIQEVHTLVAQGKLGKRLMAGLGTFWQLSLPLPALTYWWSRIAPELQGHPGVRGRLAYVLGRRCLQKGDRPAARFFFQGALRDAGPGEDFQRLTRAELAQLEPKK